VRQVALHHLLTRPGNRLAVSALASPGRVEDERVATADRIPLGNAAIARVLEHRLVLQTSIFSQTPASEWTNNSDLLVPDFYSPDTDRWHVAIQSWIIDVDGLTVVVDTGAGNDRDRPHVPYFDHLSTGFLAALDSAGIDRGRVDVVVNTHIHADHVGWNTMLESGSWTPTFPNARYVLPAADYRYFQPDESTMRRAPRSEDELVRQRGIQQLIADSVWPIEQAGQLVLWSNDYQVSPSLRLRPAPGHTPGSSVLWLDAGEPAVFIGDITHSPLQLRRPDDACSFDEDPGAAAYARRKILTDAAAAGAVVIPAHYPGRGGATIRAVDDQFDIDRWLDTEPL
jgi:glyoxylase-like metal-dependent hydrolase (beta-lactamase superfamily II)